MAHKNTLEELKDIVEQEINEYRKLIEDGLNSDEIKKLEQDIKDQAIKTKEKAIKILNKW